MLAAYEAAIGPAIRAVAGVTIPPSEKVRRGPKKKKADKTTSGQGAGSTKPPPKQKVVTNNVPGSHHGNERSATEHRGHVHQPAASHPASFFVQPQAPPQPVHDPPIFEMMERQALRRRKVEALESLAHTTALFLAEFMDFKKAQQAAAASSPLTFSVTAGPPPPQANPSAGSAYAAAAAGMAANLFQPPSDVNGWDDQNDGAGDERSGRPSGSESSADNSDDDDGDIPARAAQGNADEEEYDSEATSDELGEYGMGSEEEGPEVKVEHD